MTTTNKGFDIMTGLYTTRYYARKACPGDKGNTTGKLYAVTARTSALFQVM